MTSVAVTANMGCKLVYKLVFVAFALHICKTQESEYKEQDNKCALPNPLDDDNCLNEELCINYRRGKIPRIPDYYYEKYGIRYEHTPSSIYDVGKFEAAFDDLPRDFNRSCFNIPSYNETQCKRRILRIDIKLNNLDRCSGPIVDIFNYYKYYGKRYYYGGKVFGFAEGGLLSYTNKDGCCCHNRAFEVWPNVFKKGTKKIRIYVAHNYLRVITDQGFDRFICDSCLLNLNNCDDISRYRQKLHVLINTCHSKYSDYANCVYGYPHGDCVKYVCLKWETCACGRTWLKHNHERSKPVP